MIDGNLYGLLNPVAALFAGMVTSLHCVGMCGPLACTFIGDRNGGKLEILDLLYYQLARLMTYSILGGLAGLLGSQLILALGGAPSRLMPIALLVFFLAVALRIERVAPRIPFIGQLSRRLMRKCYSLSGRTRAIGLGFATPLLPCGPLYLAFWVACMSGSSREGAVMLLFFGVGTAPALLASQLGWRWLTQKVTAKTLARWRVGMAATAAIVLLFRVMIDLDFSSVSSMEDICFWR